MAASQDLIRRKLQGIKASPQTLYDEGYCARGDMENRIKKQQLDLYADSTRCHNLVAQPTPAQIIRLRAF